MEYTTLILILPLLTFLVLGLLGTKLKPFTAGCIGTLSLAVVVLLAYSMAIFLDTTGRRGTRTRYSAEL